MREGIREVLGQTQYFGLVLSIGAYLFACWLKNKTKLAVLNPLLVSAALIIAVLFGIGMDYSSYNKGASYLGWLLTPAAVCLAIPLYKQLHLLKKHGAAVAVGITFWCGHQYSEYFPHVQGIGDGPCPLCDPSS